MNEAGVKRDTKRVGDISEAIVIAEFVKAGYYVSIPFGENHRYDLIVERDNVLSRIQVKTGRLRKGVILFNRCSAHFHRNGKNRPYTRDEIDYFAVDCRDTDGVYVISVDDGPMTTGSLRVAPTKNGQGKHLRWASGYLLNERSTKSGRADLNLWSICEAPSAPL